MEPLHRATSAHSHASTPSVNEINALAGAAVTGTVPADVEAAHQLRKASSRRSSFSATPEDEEHSATTAATPSEKTEIAGEKGSDPEGAAEEQEGGLRAWLVVAGAFFANWIVFGPGNSFGVLFRAYLAPSTPERPSASPVYFSGTQGFIFTSLIGGCAIGFAFACGPLANLFVRNFGVRVPVIVGVLAMTLALELGSLANGRTGWWQLLLSQGILYGAGGSLVFIPSIGLPAQYFDKKKGLATGIAASGSGVGALVLAPIAQAVIDRTNSTAWALRVIGFINLFLGILCIFLLKPKTRVGVQYSSFDLSVFKVPGFAIHLVGAFLYLCSYGTPLFFVTTFCATLGISGIQSSGVISLMAAGNTVGRLALGTAADRYGTINVLIASTFLNGVLSCVWWMFSRSFSAIAAWGFFWGFTAGAYWALAVPACARIVGLQKLGSAVALFFLSSGVPPIIGGVIGSSLLERGTESFGVTRNDPRAYRWVILWAGLCSIGASICWIYVRFVNFRWKANA